jgi:lysophospholipase L1-like esterase
LQPRLHSALIDPAAISLLIGTNDLHGLGKSTDLAAIGDQMSNLIQQIRRLAPNAALLVNSIPPRSTHFSDRILSLNDRYSRIASENGATYIDLWPTLAGPDGAIRSEMTTDGLHLSVAGYRAWTDILRPQLVRLVS